MTEKSISDAYKEYKDYCPCCGRPNMKKKVTPENIIKQAFYRINRRVRVQYKEKGITSDLTLDDLRYLWDRDKAHLLRFPSIDRINNLGNYTRDNCQFIEHSLNAAKDRRRPVLQYDLNGNFLMEFPSITHAAAFVGSSTVSIWRAVTGDRRFSYGYMWRYKTSKGIPKIIDTHNKYKGKTIIQMDFNGVFIREYDSVAQAAKEMGCTSSAITYALKGIGRTAMGFLWRYKE